MAVDRRSGRAPRWKARLAPPSPTRPPRWLTVVLLAAALSLDSADRSTLSAVEAQLEAQLHIGPTGFGLLAALPPIVGMVATFPVGMLVDQITRTRLLGIVTALWALAEAVSTFSPSFAVLLVARIFLGGVLAAVPAVVSLAGDYYPVAERARMFGYILAGELAGTAFGYLASGQIGLIISWRWGFATLAVIGATLAVLVWRLREPARGTRRWEQPEPSVRPDDGHHSEGGGELEHEVREHHVRAPEEIVLHRDPRRMSVREVVRYVLGVRSNVVLILASALSYLFLAGVQTFAFAFASQQLHLSTGASTLALVAVGTGAVLGVLVAGRVSDRLIARGRLNARPLTAAVALGLATLCFVPGSLAPDAWVSVPLFVIGAVGLGGSNPPLDSARLDVIHHNAWGRTEGIRGAVRLAGYAVAPLLVGTLAVAVGLAWAFVVLTAALALAAMVVLIGVRYYPADVSAAIATTETLDPDQPGPPTLDR